MEALKHPSRDVNAGGGTDMHASSDTICPAVFCHYCSVSLLTHGTIEYDIPKKSYLLLLKKVILFPFIGHFKGGRENTWDRGNGAQQQPMTALPRVRYGALRSHHVIVSTTAGRSAIFKRDGVEIFRLRLIQHMGKGKRGQQKCHYCQTCAWQ